jgi:phosphoenolpyruvate synthase/pyruvate phosphate dikinase
VTTSEAVPAPLDGHRAPRPWPVLLALGDPLASDPAFTGRKAAALARACTGGLAVLEGVVLTTAFCADIDDGVPVAAHPAVRVAFEAIGGSARDLVVRSSSPLEDTPGSSEAGRYVSVVGVAGFEAFTRAVERVLVSRALNRRRGAPMAVLVQPREGWSRTT